MSPSRRRAAVQYLVRKHRVSQRRACRGGCARDREGSFEPRIAAKHQRRLAGFDEAVISLYGKGMTTGDIAAHLAEVYDTDVSRDLASTVTNAVVAEIEGLASDLEHPARHRNGDPAIGQLNSDCLPLVRAPAGAQG